MPNELPPRLPPHRIRMRNDTDDMAVDLRPGGKWVLVCPNFLQPSKLGAVSVVGDRKDQTNHGYSFGNSNSRGSKN